MMDFNIDVAAVGAALGGAVYLIGTMRQRLIDVEKRVNRIDSEVTKENALLCEIKERLIAIELCLKCTAKNGDG